MLDETIWSASFSPDGQQILTSSLDQQINVWNLDGTERRLVGLLASDGPRSARFSPDGRWVLTISEDRRTDGGAGQTTSEEAQWTARLWPAAGSGAPLVLQPLGSGLVAATFTEDSERLVTVTTDGTTRVWPLERAALQEALWRESAVCLLPAERRALLSEAEDLADLRAAACETRVAELSGGGLRPAGAPSLSSLTASPPMASCITWTSPPRSQSRIRSALGLPHGE